MQEINIKTGKVLFQWNSADHVPYAQSEQPLPAAASDPWDWFHLNAIKVDTNGNFLIDARDTWTTYEVSPRTGKIEWRLGGKDSSFKVEAAKGQVLDSAGEIFAWQHDPEAHGNGIYTFFDNDAAGTANTGTNILVDLPYSRAITVKLNYRTHVATLIKSDNQPEGLSASSQGNAQLLSNGGLFVGWGIQACLDEVADRLGVGHAGGGGGAANEFARWWPHRHMLVAAAARVVADEGELGYVDREQVESARLRIPAEVGCHRVRVAALPGRVVVRVGGAPDFELSCRRRRRLVITLCTRIRGSRKRSRALVDCHIIDSHSSPSST